MDIFTLCTLLLLSLHAGGSEVGLYSALLEKLIFLLKSDHLTTFLKIQVMQV